MTLERAFRFSSILLAVSGFTGLVLAGEVPFWLLLLGYGGIGASLLKAMGWGEGWRIYHLSRGSWNILIILALIGFLVDFLWLSPGMLQAGTHFLIILMVNKLLTLHGRKDFLHLYALSLLALLASAALTVEIWYASIFVAYLLVAIWTLLLYHLRNEGEDSCAGTAPGQRGTQADRRLALISARFFWTTNGIALGALCLTVLIFFLVPRIGAGFFEKQRLELIRTSGFSEKVDLGVIGAVKQDQTVVMRVEFPDQGGPPLERLYFRGAAYDRYDGASWSNSLSRRRAIGRGTDGVFRIAEHLIPGPNVGALRQEVLIEALDTPTLFGAPFVQSLEGNVPVMQVDGMGGLSLPHPPAARLQYTAFSATALLLPVERVATSLDYPDEIRGQYLDLPEGIGRVRELAEQVTRQARTPYERIAVVERYLRGNYRYSLDIGTTLPANPVDEFLFVRKTGYCEHYATAMVLMLRTLGIPARLVTGFLQGEWNDFGNYYTVRQRDAHAWVEAYFTQSGWITFDPTPAAGTVPVTPVWTQAVRVVDSMRLRWDRFVIRYSLHDQVLVVQGIRERGEQIRAQVARLLTAAHRSLNLGEWRFSAPGRPVYTVVIGTLAACLMTIGAVAGLTLWRRWKRISCPGLQTSRQVAAVRMYSRMLHVLDARGLRKPPGATPLEFARVVAKRSAVAGSFVKMLTDLYYRVRFGSEAMTAEDQALAEDWLNGLRTMKLS